MMAQRSKPLQLRLLLQLILLIQAQSGFTLQHVELKSFFCKADSFTLQCTLCNSFLCNYLLGCSHKGTCLLSECQGVSVIVILKILFCQRLTSGIILHIAFLFICLSFSSLLPFLNTSQYHQPQTLTTCGECELTDGMLLVGPCLPLKQIHHTDLDTAFSH